MRASSSMNPKEYAALLNGFGAVSFFVNLIFDSFRRGDFARPVPFVVELLPLSLWFQTAE